MIDEICYFTMLEVENAIRQRFPRLQYDIRIQYCGWVNIEDNKNIYYSIYQEKSTTGMDWPDGSEFFRHSKTTGVMWIHFYNKCCMLEIGRKGRNKNLFLKIEYADPKFSPEYVAQRVMRFLK